MTPSVRASYRNYWLAAAFFALGIAAAILLYLAQTGPGPQPANARELPSQADEALPAASIVDVAYPQKGMDYEVSQPGSVRAYETVHLYAKVSGFLQVQNVDIGDRVKEGEVLAVVAVPELVKQMQRNKASLAQIHARVKQMEAHVVSAQADHEAAKAAVDQADAAYMSASAWVRYRSKQYGRLKDLFILKSIEEKVADESKERFEASLETERAAKATIATSKANVAAAAAKIDQAKADVLGAESEVDVVQADLEKTQVLIDYATIKAPFGGTICARTYFPGDFIRSAGDGVSQPLLTIQRTDRLRVVVKVPDTAVPYLDKGDAAIVQIDSLPGRRFRGFVSRKSGFEDPNTRLMHVEVDLPNPTGEIGAGMYGKVTILLDRFPNLLSIPANCVVKTGHGHSAVYVTHHGHVQLSEVQVCKNNGARIAVSSGLRPDDLIVLEPGAGFTVGTAVETRLIPQPTHDFAEDSTEDAQVK